MPSPRARPARRSSASPTRARKSWTSIKGSPALDAGLLAAAQAVEHYEISRYGTLRAWAEALGLDDAIPLFNATLEEEEATDQALTEIAETVVNQQAEAA
jgi:ferritin-like metal-binding protein YciE